MAGIPAYTEPKYIKGNSATLDKILDIYSLGVLLWKLQTTIEDEQSIIIIEDEKTTVEIS
ncbi:774_t:CDS:2 [Dentiscutata heterogama]|uniref:774_t:CDS:1 n=1 Tax=Dentiscutata heterogama TaxID=1316150 RepID=A0ACA9KB69_9GLOM|nr:774_t:CDS:2 [Dentiscutata heterogama]